MTLLVAVTEAPVRIERLYDSELIAQTLTHPRIFPHISDDACSSPSELSIPDDPRYQFPFLAAYDGSEYLGLFMVHAHNLVLHEVHTCLLPAAWGPRSLRAARACIRWIFDNTACRRLITSVPDDNPLAFRLAVRAGMEAYGRNPKSIQRAGVLRDLIMLGISKE